MGLEDDRGEELDPVGDELAVVCLAQLAGLGIKTKRWARSRATRDARR